MLFDFESLKLKAPDLFTDRQRERERYERMTGDVHRYYCLNSSSVIKSKSHLRKHKQSVPQRKQIYTAEDHFKDYFQFLHLADACIK